LFLIAKQRDMGPMQVKSVARPRPSDVMPLLPALGEKYPGGCTWLERRLYDVSAGRAFLLAAHFGGAVAALAIETPKGLHIRKLSTFVVSSHWRRQGLGTALLTSLRRSWLAREIDSAFVTIDRNDAPTQEFFRKNGFVPDPNILIPYEQARFDRLFRWAAANDPLANSTAVH
jgi:N-acetylglutamate synthase-like GNAT family acetyltransferase